MVHRTTFYKHYEDKYALLEQGIRQMYDDLLAAKEHQPPSAYSVEHPPPYFMRLFEHAGQHQQFYRLMLCGEGIGRFQKLLKEYIAEVVSTSMGESSQTNQHFAVPLLASWPGGLSMTCLLPRIRWRNICYRPMALWPLLLDVRGDNHAIPVFQRMGILRFCSLLWKMVAFLLAHYHPFIQRAMARLYATEHHELFPRKHSSGYKPSLKL
jgi:AcrR family transcriptional regulator